MFLTLAWTFQSNQEDAAFGHAVSGGDIDGDGFADVIVGAPQLEIVPYVNGTISVYRGTATGPDVLASWVIEADEPSGWGWSVAAAGDVNGDGFTDVIAGAPYADNVGTSDGRAALHLGSSVGLEAVPAWDVLSDSGDGNFGWSVSSAGDVNGDGYADVVVGGPNEDVLDTNWGAAHVFLGSASGLETTAAWTAFGTQSNGYLGVDVAAAGDVDGDGFGDVIVGANGEEFGEFDEGRAYVWLGSAAGLEAAYVWSAEGDQADAEFGSSVASAGDIDGDGYDEVIVGAPRWAVGQPNEGAVFLYNRSSTGPAATASWIEQSNSLGVRFGDAVSGAGDLNADSYDDVVVGATSFSNPESEEGRAFVYLGFPTGLAVAPSWFAEANVANANFGTAVGSVGDTNADGFADLIVGAPWFAAPLFAEGSAYVYLGGSTFDADGDGIIDDLDLCFGNNPSGDEDADGVCLLDADGTTGDCNDQNAAVFPGAVEVCDGLDTSCAGALASDEADVDDDGVATCEGDCDDTNATIFPGAEQLCDGIDNACLNSLPPDEMDADGDGAFLCEGDCDDGNTTIGPDFEESCDGADNDCDNDVDEACDAPPPATDGGAEGCGCDAPTSHGTAGTAALLLAVLLRRRRSCFETPQGTSSAATSS